MYGDTVLFFHDNIMEGFENIIVVHSASHGLAFVRMERDDGDEYFRQSAGCYPFPFLPTPFYWRDDGRICKELGSIY